jgi:DNA polymerase-3 subunit delta
MIISLVGRNDFLRQRKLQQLTAQFLKKENELALERIDASEAEFNQILDAVQSVPFLASKKMVVVRELSANKQAAQNIEQLISAVSPTTELIVVEPEPDKRTAYFKELKRLTELEEFNELDIHQLTRWLMDEAKNHNVNLSQNTAGLLVERIGTNQAILASELDKLITYNPDVSQESIELLTEKNPQSKVFDLLDAMFGGNKQKAMQLYDEQRAQKVEPQAILALIVWQLQMLTLAKLGTGKTSTQIAQEAKVSPYPLTKAQALAAKLSTAKLHEMIEEALQIDYRSKTRGLDLDEALKTFITTI